MRTKYMYNLDISVHTLTPLNLNVNQTSSGIRDITNAEAARMRLLWSQLRDKMHGRPSTHSSQPFAQGIQLKPSS